jgi:UDP-glucuronate 4-epimerase
MRHILITGGAGFIGSNLADRLLAGGARVTLVDNFDDFYDARRKRANVTAAVTNPRCTLVEADIRDAAAMKRLWTDAPIDVVVHLAARAGVRPSLSRAALYADVNINGTLVLLDLCREHGPKHFVFASSSSVYGNQKKVPFSETDAVDHPISPYAATKKAGELMCHAYHHLYGMDITCLRFFTVYGPRIRPDLAIGKFTDCIQHGRPMTLFGDGHTERDYTWIDDILDGVIRAIDRPMGYEIINLGESRPVKLLQLVHIIEAALGMKAIIRYEPMQPGDVDRTFADIARAKELLGYEPTTTIEDGIARYTEWVRHQSLS